jgi:hypothetical protein
VRSRFDPYARRLTPGITAPGMLYVACSRVGSLQRLSLRSYEEDAAYVDPHVRLFYTRVQHARNAAFLQAPPPPPASTSTDARVGWRDLFFPAHAHDDADPRYLLRMLDNLGDIIDDAVAHVAAWCADNARA